MTVTERPLGDGLLRSVVPAVSSYLFVTWGIMATPASASPVSGLLEGYLAGLGASAEQIILIAKDHEVALALRVDGSGRCCSTSIGCRVRRRSQGFGPEKGIPASWLGGSRPVWA